MKPFNVTKGKLAGTQIQARNLDHAKKLIKARLRRLREKESRLTEVEKDFILSALDLMVSDFSPQMIQKENGEWMKTDEAIEIWDSIINKFQLSV